MIEHARDAFMCVYICKLFHEYGKPERLDTRCHVDSDNWFGMVYEGVQSVCEFVEYGGDDFQTKIYFSDPPMPEYYRLCRDYCQLYGVRLKENPFMIAAEKYVNDMLSHHIDGCSRYGWTLHTRINHERASGILFAYSSEYFGHHALLDLCEVMLEICYFYEERLEVLKEAVNTRKNQSQRKRRPPDER